MHCPQCGHENPDDAQFCGECGAAQREGRREPGPYRPMESVDGSGDIPPRDLGQLIDATFKVYRKAVIPFFAIALIPQIPNMLSLAVGGTVEDASLTDTSLTETILTLASLLIGIVAGAASIFCLGQVLTGRNVDVMDCYGRALNVLLPALAVSVVIGLALTAPFILAAGFGYVADKVDFFVVRILAGSIALVLVVIGIPLFFYVLVIWFFAVQAVVIETKSTFDALRRSQELVKGNWWRVFGIGVGFVLLGIALLIPAIVASVIVGFINAVLSNVVLGVAVALVTPVLYIGSTLLYIDLRVRREDYDLQSLVDDLARRPKEARL